MCYPSTEVLPIGQVRVLTSIDGIMYDLEYVVVSMAAAEDIVLLGDPIRDVADIILGAHDINIAPKI